MKKHPWYVWMSVFGFFWLAFLGLRAVEPSRRMRFLGWAAYWFVGQFLLPAVVLMELWQRVPWPSAGMAMGSFFVIWMAVYGLGVLMTIRMDRQLR